MYYKWLLGFRGSEATPGKTSYEYSTMHFMALFQNSNASKIVVLCGRRTKFKAERNDPLWQFSMKSQSQCYPFKQRPRHNVGVEDINRITPPAHLSETLSTVTTWWRRPKVWVWLNRKNRRDPSCPSPSIFVSVALPVYNILPYTGVTRGKGKFGIHTT